MLIEDAKQIEAKITELERLRGIARSIKGFQTRANQLQEPVLILNPLTVLLAEFRKHNIAVDLRSCSPTALMLKKHTAYVTTHFENNPDSILESGEKLRREFWEFLVIKKFPRTVMTALLKSWQKYVDTLIPPEKTELLDTLARVPAFTTNANKIRRLYEEVRTRRQKLPQSSTDLDRLKAIPMELAKLWQNFGGDDIPEAVLNFLRAASSDGAHLVQLTPTVQDWLKEHNLEQSVRLVF